MAGYFGNSIRKVIHEAISAAIEAERRDMRIHLKGKIVSYDFNGGNPIAKIKPLLKQKFADKEVEAPDLEEVPVRFQRFGGFVIHKELEVGDEVDLFFMDRSSDPYQVDGESMDGAPGRMNDLSDAVAYPTGHNEKRKTADVPQNGTWLGSESGQQGIFLGKDGSVTVKRGTSTVFMKADGSEIDTKVGSGSRVRQRGSRVDVTQGGDEGGSRVVTEDGPSNILWAD